MKTLCALLLLVPMAACAAEPLPDAPKPHRDRTELTLLAIDAGTRTLDAYSTRRCLSQGNRELILPPWITDRTPVMYLYSEAVVGFNYMLMLELKKHHHNRLAHLVPMIDIAQDAPWAVHNLFLRRRR